MLPYMLERIDDIGRRSFEYRERSFLDVWKANIWVTTSGVWSLAPMHCLLANTSLDHIMYSVDYPFTSNERGKSWFEELERSGLVDQEGLDKIAHKNAEALLKLNKFN